MGHINAVICPNCGGIEFKLFIIDGTVMNHGAEVELNSMSHPSHGVRATCILCEYEHAFQARSVFHKLGQEDEKIIREMLE